MRTHKNGIKVYPFKIPKPFEKKLVVQVDKEYAFYNKLHQHQEIQISYLVKGTGKLIIADSVHPFNAGDLFVIGGHIPHLFQSEEKSFKSHMISIFFTKHTFGKDFFDHPELEELLPFFLKAEGGFRLDISSITVKKIMLELPKADKFYRFLLFLKLLKNLSYLKTNILTGFTYPKQISNTEGQRMQIVFDYVLNNFQKEIKLEKISQLAYMTPNAFCRYFKQHTNKTFFQFLIELRIAHACQLLKNDPHCPISEISYKSGFNSISHFNRKFREIKKMTPSEYTGYPNRILGF